LGICGKITISIFLNHKDELIIMKYEEKSDGFKNIPFPAITFNNELQIKYIYVLFVQYFYKFSIESVLKKFGNDR
jgi:hypothetical protein